MSEVTSSAEAKATPDTGAKLSPAQKNAKALELAKREQGVTDFELAEAVGVKNKLPMAGMLARLLKAGVVTVSEDMRGGSKVYRADKNAELPKPSAKPKRKPGRPKMTAAEKASAKAARKDAEGLARRERESPMVTALRLAARPEGVIVDELASARGSTQVGPFTRTLRNGVASGQLAVSGEKRNGRDVYVATGKEATKKRAAKKAAKSAKKDLAAPAQPVVQNTDTSSSQAEVVLAGGAAPSRNQAIAAVLRSIADLIEN